MRICLIAEGSYPYVTGGVSSWIQMLISNMKEHEFIIYAISAKKDDKLTYKYEIPENVLEIKDIYLEIDESKKRRSKKKVTLQESEKEILKNLMVGKYFQWSDMFDCMKRLKEYNTVDILMSEDFFDITRDVAKEYYPYIVFNDFFWTMRSMMLTIFEILKSDISKADIYHSVSTGYAGLLGAMGKYMNDGKFLLTEHGIYTREREEEIIKADWVKGYFKDNWIKYFYSVSRAAYTYSDKVISLFEKNRKLQIELGCNENKIEIIPNGVSLEDFKNINAYKDEAEIINVGAIVRVVPIKDIKTLIQAFVEANEEYKNMRLYIIGPTDEDEEYKKECDDLIESMQNENIIFTGRVNVADYIGKMDVLVLSSISEGQPLVILEGMAARKPFVSTDVGSCKELLYGSKEDNLGDCGIIVPVMGYREMAQGILKLARDKRLRENMGRIGLERVSKYYTLEQFIDGYKNIYRELVK